MCSTIIPGLSSSCCPGVNGCAAGIGRHQIKVNKWGVAAGGNARTGLEDNICMNRAAGAVKRRAVERVVAISEGLMPLRHTSRGPAFSVAESLNFPENGCFICILMKNLFNISPKLTLLLTTLRVSWLAGS